DAAVLSAAWLRASAASLAAQAVTQQAPRRDARMAAVRPASPDARMVAPCRLQRSRLRASDSPADAARTRAAVASPEATPRERPVVVRPARASQPMGAQRASTAPTCGAQALQSVQARVAASEVLPAAEAARQEVC